jgi:hypothetical protein
LTSLINLSISTETAKRLKRNRYDFERTNNEQSKKAKRIKRKNDISLITDTLVIQNELDKATLQVGEDFLSNEQGKEFNIIKS